VGCGNSPCRFLVGGERVLFTFTKLFREGIMDGALGFIFQRFYFSVGSGCIINFYVLGIFFFMGQAKLLSDHLELFGCMKFSTNVSILIFVFFALVIGIFVEGINHICTQCYQENKSKLSKQNGELKFIGKILFFLAGLSINEAGQDRWENEKNEGKTFQNSHLKFMYKPDTKELIDKDEVYPAIRISALKIARKLEKKDINRFSELSYMARTMSTSFLLILLHSCYITISTVSIWCCNGWSNANLFYLVWFIVSGLLMILTRIMAWCFSKKYVRNIGELYEALDFHKKPAETEKVDVGVA
jgi:hypothetical protein